MDTIYTLSMLLSVISFAVATVFTPGPNNIMLLSSGLTFGYKRSVPHILGVMLGFPAIVLAVGFGIGSLLELYPRIFDLLKIIGIGYLLWMAWHMANTSGEVRAKASTTDKPFSFIQAALFQWVNPKAWVMAVTAITSFTTKDAIDSQVFIIAFVYLCAGLFSTHTWALGGVFLQRWLKNPYAIKLFNRVMAGMIVLSIVPFLFS